MSRHEVEVGPGPALEVRLAAGRVEIVPGRDGVVAVEVGGRDADRVVVERIGESVVSIHSDDRGRRVQATVTAAVPAGCDADLAVASAGVRARAELGSVRVKSASGDVDLAGAETVEVTSASGDVRIARVSGSARVSTASGDVQVGSAGAGAEIRTASGDVRLGDARGDVSLTTASGDASVGRHEGDELVISTVSGDVALALAPGRRVDVDLNTLSGRIDLPAAPAAPRQPATGAVTRLRFRSVSGDLRVTRAGGGA